MTTKRSLIVPVAAVLIANATYGADNTPVAVDRANYDRTMITLVLGAGGITFTGTNKIEFVLKHGDTSTVGDHVAIAATDFSWRDGTSLGSNGIIRSLVAAQAAAVLIGDYVGTKKYLSLLADFSGTHATGTPIAAFALQFGGLVGATI